MDAGVSDWTCVDFLVVLSVRDVAGQVFGRKS
jgi:hypothetical protein